jgi:hypothetical protein
MALNDDPTDTVESTAEMIWDLAEGYAFLVGVAAESASTEALRSLYQVTERLHSQAKLTNRSELAYCLEAARQRLAFRIG